MKRVVEVELEDGDLLAVTYDREVFIRASAEAVPTAILGGRWAESGATVDALAESIVSWDLTDDDGGGHPITRESLSQLPLWLVYKIERALTADAFDSE
jgi:hypothetical protein